MTNQSKMRALARESLKLVKDRAPAIVDERILPEMFDEVAHYTGELMGKLTNLDGENEKAVTMAHGIIYDGLLNETIDQIRETMLKAAGKRLKKLSAK